MVTRPGADSTQQVDCLVELTWPAGCHLWWRARHSGSGSQIAAALDELALRVDIDPPADTAPPVRPRIGYSLAAWVHNSVIEHRADTVDLAELPAALRAHATSIRAHPL
ncbi:hypothetical protein [Nocardia bovistercoris]|uniref:Uncharacterized protein n=1 Tax=Nocardia bovistercoris TaxID=2785916 RepID=A0A931IH04_9NOCA|nr:hypothetical protein [Nocardia bovistercoris]MBH0780226.1 hypothetical protein [Nocardia bovistercoris]